VGNTHPALDLLSAYSDGELDPAQLESVGRHVAACLRCRTEIAAFTSFDAALVKTPHLACATARTLVSASLDRETLPEEGPALAEHITSCASCAADRTAWAGLDTALAALPQMLPPTRVDLAIAALVNPRRRVRTWALQPALRGLVATAVIAIALALAALGVPRTGPVAVPGDQSAIVASALSVLDTRTNTLYVIDPAAATLSVRDATTNQELGAPINVGGRPTAVALNASGDTVLVLDAQQKTVTSVDTVRRAVVSTVPVGVAGTPTGIQVAPSGQVLVTATNPTGTGGKSSGVVAIVDGGKTLGVVSLDVAPRRLVVDPSGSRVLLVSPTGTTLADAHTLAPLENLNGGVSAAFSASGNGGAVLAGVDRGRLTFWGTNAPAAVDLEGAPVALVALPDGGYGVLLSAGGTSHIVLVSSAGEVQGTVDVAGTGADLTFDASSGRFAVVGGSSVAFAARPQAAAASQRPIGSTAPSTTPPSTTSPSPTGSPTASTPAATLVPAPVTSAAPPLGGLTQFSVPGGKQPFLARASNGRIWFVDQNNKLNSLITSSRATFAFAQLPNDTIIRGLAVSPNYVYAIDSHAGLTVFAIASERATTQTLTFWSGGAAILATSLDDRLWIAKPGGHQIFSYEPRTRRIDIVDVADASLSALAADDAGRIWFANESRKSLGYYDTTTARTVEMAIDRRGHVTALLATGGTLWAGTDAGELLAVRANQLAISASVGAPITGLSNGPSGAWYAASSPDGLIYGPTSGGAALRVAPASARTLTFDASGNGWLSDPSAGLFYVFDTSVRE
jgi:DNA-binding beta-propeller fold protein YncE